MDGWKTEYKRLEVRVSGRDTVDVLKHSKPVAKNISSRKIKIFASLLCFFVEIVSLSFAFYGP